jgi:Papain family cysteine protease
MPKSFVEGLASVADLKPSEIAILTHSGIRSYEDLYSLVHCFPSISEAGVRLPVLSNLATKGVGTTSAFARAAGRSAGSSPSSPPHQHGASHPPAAHWAVGKSVSIPPVGGSGSPGGPPSSGASGSTSPPGPPGNGLIDVRIRNSSWSVGDQGQRATCVAFASAACAEHRRATGSLPAAVDLSEQFLFWAIKNRTSDQHSLVEGTRLEYARDALDPTGICEEALWPYNPQSIVGTFCQNGHGGPSTAALADASRNALKTATYQVFHAWGTGATAVLAALSRGNPVAVTLPVYGDPYDKTLPDNWQTLSGVTYGRVLNPPPVSVVRSGHAVCITGFQPDSREPKGGYFIFRNSWGTTWAANAPASIGLGYHSPEPGYGDISATYVDDFLWELLEL